MNIKSIIKRVREIYPLIKPFLKNNIAFIVITETVVLLGLLMPLIIRYLIDDVITLNHWDNLPKFIFYMAVAIIGSRLLTITTNILYNTFSANIEANARNSLFSVIIRKKLSFFNRVGDGEILDRLMRSPEQLHPIISLYLERIISSSATIIVVFVIIFSIQPKLAFISLLAAPVFIAVYLKTRALFFSQVLAAREETGRLSEFYASTVQNIKHIKNIVAEDLSVSESVSRNQHLKELGLKYSITGAIVNNLAQIVTQFNQLGVLIIGALLIKSGRMTVGTLVAFYSYIDILYRPMLSLIQTLNDVNGSVVDIERYLEFYGTDETENQERGNHEELANSVEFKDLSFSFVDKKVLDNINLVVTPGDKILLTGKSGIGKSTMMYLLKKLYDNYKGQIKVGSQNIEDVNILHLRKGIAYLDQSDKFLPITLRENFKIYNPLISDSEIIKLLRMTHLYDLFFSGEKEGLDTVIFKNGSIFSGGQRRRLSVSLVLASPARTVILDEPFIGVDRSTINELWTDIKELLKEKTVIVIDHSLSDPDFFNKVLELDGEGNLLEKQGSK